MSGIFKERKQYRPFEYDSITTPFINAMWASHWSHNEFNFTSDTQDFLTELSEEEKELIKKSALLISQIEVTVKSFWGKVGDTLPKPEIADMGAVFGGVEVIHSRAYSKILEVLNLNDEFEKLFEEEAVVNRVNYLSKYNEKVYDNDKKSFLYSLILFTLFTEATSLFSQFYILLGFNRFRGLMKDISNIVQYTAKEETLHMEGGVALINQIIKENPELNDESFKKRIYEETQVALKAEEGLIDWMVGNYENEFLSADLLKKYIKYRLNMCLDKIGFNKPFKIYQEDLDKFLWMEEEILAPALTDFFSKKPIDYSKASRSFNEDELF